MKRIQTSTRAVDLFGAGKDGFTNGSPLDGKASTDLEASFFNHTQEAIVRVIERAKLSLSETDYDQFSTALDVIYAALNSPAFTGSPTVPTPQDRDNSKKIVNTEWVQTQLQSKVPRMQLPMLNLNRDSGRFFDPDITNANVRRDVYLHGAPFHVSHLALYNGSIVTDAGQFIYNNSTFGGTQGALNANILSLLEAMGRNNKRYGTEFHIAEFTTSLHPGTHYPEFVTLPAGPGWLSSVNFANTQGLISCMYWIRALNGQLGAELGEGGLCYRNGVSGSTIINPEDGWLHICHAGDWDSGYIHAGHLYATPGARYQIALPAMVLGDVHGAIHRSPILGVSY